MSGPGQAWVTQGHHQGPIQGNGMRRCDSQHGVRCPDSRTSSFGREENSGHSPWFIHILCFRFLLKGCIDGPETIRKEQNYLSIFAYLSIYLIIYIFIYLSTDLPGFFFRPIHLRNVSIRRTSNVHYFRSSAFTKHFSKDKKRTYGKC